MKEYDINQGKAENRKDKKWEAGEYRVGLKEDVSMLHNGQKIERQNRQKGQHKRWQNRLNDC